MAWSFRRLRSDRSRSGCRCRRVGRLRRSFGKRSWRSMGSASAGCRRLYQDTRNRISRGLYAALLCACSVSGKDIVAPAEPGFVSVVSRSGLAGTDNLDWGDLGPPGGSHPQPVTILSDDGLVVVVTNSVIPPGNFPAPFYRANQNLVGGWRGDFALGDELIYTGGAQVITIDFPRPIATAGMQVQPGTLIASFTTRIEALNAGPPSCHSRGRQPCCLTRACC